MSGLRDRGKISEGNWRVRLSLVQGGPTLRIVLSVDCRVGMRKDSAPGVGTDLENS